MRTQHGIGRKGALSWKLVIALVFAVLLIAPLLLIYREFVGGAPPAAGVSIQRLAYHGWTNSWSMSNGKVEVIVVPAIGRIMQFRFKGDTGPFWENSSLYGQSPDPASSQWGNFGGDKTWPSPQSKWPIWTPRSWPPPPAFDSMAVDVQLNGEALTMQSAVDPYFGIQTERVIRLDPSRPRMSVVTTYEKAKETTEPSGPVATNAVGIWIITQLNHPVGVFVPIPKSCPFPDGYDKQSNEIPPSLKKLDRLLSLSRSTNSSFKIGNNAENLVWVGENVVLRIDSPRTIGAEYPDNGCSAEVYTNPDPLAYVELEMLGSMSRMRVGDRISQTNVYTLYPRKGLSPEAEAREVLGL